MLNDVGIDRVRGNACVSAANWAGVGGTAAGRAGVAGSAPAAALSASRAAPPAAPSAAPFRKPRRSTDVSCGFFDDVFMTQSPDACPALFPQIRWSRLQAPESREAKNRKMKQKSTASSPPFMIGQKARGKWVR